MKKMRKILDSNVFWLVISFVVSLAVWVYVTSVETVESTREFQIPVEIVGEETLLNMRELVVTDVDTNTVTVEITGPRRVVNSLSSSDLSAQVDVSRLSQAAYTSLNYTIVYPAGTDRRNLTVVKKSHDTVNFMVSKLTTKAVPIQGGFDGSGAEGFITSTPIYEVQTINVTGPEAYLRNVDHVDVNFGEGMVLESTYTTPVPVKLVDASGTPCSTAYLSCSQDTIQVTVPVEALKTVPLRITPKYGAGATEENTEIVITPATVSLRGDAAILGDINQITLATVDMTAFDQEYQESFVIPLPNGVSFRSSETEATVTVKISGLSTRTFYVDSFNWKEKEENVDVTAVSRSVPILLRGPEEIISRLTPNDIWIDVDLTDYKGATGDLQVPIKVTIPNYSDVGAIQIDGEPAYTMAIRITRRGG